MGKETKTPTPIVKIREVIRDIRHDVREGKMPKMVFKRIVHCMSEVQDRRMEGRVEYPLPYILLLAFLAVLSGAEKWTEIEYFAETYKRKLNGILPQYKVIGVPSHDTFERVFGLISPDCLQRATAVFVAEELNQIKKALGIKEKMRHVAIDGKEQNGTGRKYRTDQKVANLQTLHVYDVTNAICLYSTPIGEKTNEIPVAQKILGAMKLKNCVITFDALNTQKNTVSAVIDGKGHYVGGLKGNQQLFHEEVKLLFSDDYLGNIRKKERNYRTYTEKSHNRIEKRSYFLTTNVKWFANLPEWAGLKAFICYIIETEDIVSGKKTKEVRYYISSLTDVELCADAIRSHWGIENQLHWHLDVTFGEDDNTTMDKNAFNNLSILNKMVLTLLKLIQPAYKFGLKSIRKKFGWDLITELTRMLNFLDEGQIRQAFDEHQRKKQL